MLKTMGGDSIINPLVIGVGGTVLGIVSQGIFYPLPAMLSKFPLFRGVIVAGLSVLLYES